MYKEKIEKSKSFDIAVIDGNKSINYHDMHDNAKKINYILKNNNIKVIGLYMDKSIEYIQSIYCALLSNIVFVPLNKKLPLERLEFIINDSGIDTIIAEKNHNLNFKNVLIFEDIIKGKEYLDFDISKVEKEKYIIYTSGTTGTPKGCILSAYGIDNMISQQVNIFKMNKSNMFLYLSISFDASLSDILCAFYSSSTIFINEKILKDKKEIISFFNKNKITHVDIPPSFLSFFKKEELPTLENIVIGGEISSYIDDFNRVVNVYGPTEATICTSYEVVDKNFESNCIGVPLSGVEYKIIDSILYIKSIQLFNGYKNIGNPIIDGWYCTGDLVEYKNNKYYYLGRRDNQLKHNGQMINLDEIEKIIKKINPNSFIKYENKNIILYTDKKIERKVLEKSLPAYMVPHKQFINNDYYVDKTKKKEYIQRSKIYDIFKDYKDYNTSLKELGIDSLKIIEYSLELSNIGIELSYENMYSMSISEINNVNTVYLSEKDLLKLVPKITLSDTSSGINTLVVGASGFLGIHVVEELVKKNTNVICFVRNKKKFHDMIKYYDLNIDMTYIELIEGDINKEFFGIGKIDYDKLKINVKDIYYMSGEVNNIKTIEELYDSNIKQVVNILKFKGNNKNLIYASTLSVKVSVSPQDKVIDTNYLKDDNKKLLTGYAQSKWVSDKLVSLYDNTYIMRYGMLINKIMPKNSFYTFFIDNIKKSNIVPIDKGYSMDNTSIKYAAIQTIKMRNPINNITENKKIYYKDLIIGKKIGKNNSIAMYLKEGNSLNIFETTNIKIFEK
jgi:nucleoside-diphosphate-sugar epimerase/acyl carrier protein